MKKTAAIALLFLFASVVTGCSSSKASSDSVISNDTRIEKADSHCKTTGDVLATTDTFEVGDNGHTLIASGVKDKEIAGLGCLLGTLGTPQSVVAQMDSTTAMMGRQSDEADGLKYEWSYHPDNGFDMIITEN